MDMTMLGPASARLAELQAAVAEARDRLSSIEAERRRTNREIARAAAPLREYFEEVGAGERESDPELEARLAAEVGEARSTAVLKFSRAATDPAQVSGADWIDERVEAKLAGAMRALEEREADLTEYMTDNGELVAEWVAAAAATREECELRWSEIRDALRRWQEIIGLWGPFLQPNGIAPAELPPHPLTGIERDPARGIALPVPRSLLPAEERPA